MGQKLLFLGVIACFYSIKSMESGLSGLAAPSFCIATVSNESEYDVVISHNQEELLCLRPGQVSDGIKMIPLNRYDIELVDMIMYKVENLRIKPAHQRSFFVSLYFTTFFSQESPSITSQANLYAVREINDSLLQSTTLSEHLFVHKDLPHQEDMYAVVAQLYLTGIKLKESHCEISHMFQPKSLDGDH